MAMKSAIEVFAAVYWGVLIAELIGDKSIYTVTSLALRYSRRLVMATLIAAYAAKMACAVFLGGFLLQLPPRIVAMVSAAGFLGAAVLTILRQERDDAERTAADWHRGAWAGFLSLFITEWADPGQMVTAAAAARTGLLAAVWLAGMELANRPGSLLGG